MAKVDYSTWITKQDAAAAIGVHTKQIERWAQENKLQVVKWKRPTGGPPIVVCHPRDVERIAKDRNPETEAFVVPPPKEQPATNGATQRGETITAAKPTLSADGFLQMLAGALANSQTSQTRLIEEGSQTSETRLTTLWLTLREAVRYSGLPEYMVLRLINEGKLKAMDVGAGRRGGRWRINKAVLEDLR